VTLASSCVPGALAGSTWDAVVVGAGPAGSVAALELARSGTRVLLVDRASFPRWKVCGCCLNRRALSTLEAAGLAARVQALGPRPQRRIRLAAGGREARLDLPGCVALSRERLDAALIAGAIDEGVRFLQGVRARVLDAGGAAGLHHLALVPAGGEAAVVVEARVVIAADGLGGAVAVDRLGGEHVQPGGRLGAGVVLDAGVDVDWHDETINMAVGASGYVGIARLEDGRWNVAAALDSEAVRREGSLASVVAGTLRRVGWTVPRELHDAAWRGTPRLWRRPRRVAAERLFAVGDASGYVEPFTGEGMAWALAAGRAVAPLAARAIARWEPRMINEWTDVLANRVHRGQRLSRLAARTLRRPSLAAAAAAVLAAWPGLAAPAIARLNAAELRPAGERSA
jgi:flavin-dependent dehydrogenase